MFIFKLKTPKQRSFHEQSIAYSSIEANHILIKIKTLKTPKWKKSNKTEK